MAQVYTTDQVFTGTIFDFTTDDDAVILTDVDLVTSLGVGTGFTQTGTNQTLTILGTLTVLGWNAINSTGAGNSVSVGSTGQIIHSAVNDFTAYSPATDFTFTNAGTIVGAAIGGGTSGLVINNSGTIQNTAGPSVSYFLSAGAYASSFYYLGSTPYEVLVTNSGLIQGSLDQNGDIHAVLVDDQFGGFGYLTLTNTGTLIGDVVSHAHSDTVENTGTITGDIDLGGGSDLVLNSGTVEGVFLGDGADAYRAVGNAVAASVFGGAGDDFLLGGGLQDVFYGDAGNDTLRGFEGDDGLFGGADDDKVYGGSGEDILEGGDGRDKLYGGSGEDILTGNEGRDLLFGGSGVDIFQFIDATDSVQGGLFDVIADFESGTDLCDLSEIATSSVLSFNGTGALSGGGTASLRYFVNAANGASIVQVDVDGDGTVDMRIVFANTPELTAADFIL